MGWTPAQLLRDPRRQRRAPAHDRHVPRHGGGEERQGPARSARTRPAACRGSTPPRRTGSATSCTPTTRSCRTCRTDDRWSGECLTPVGQVLFELAGLPGLDGTRARRRDCAWRTDEDASRPGIFGPKNLPDHLPQGLGRQRQRQLLAAQPRGAARGLRPASSAARSASAPCGPGWSTATCRTGSPAPTGSAKGKLVSPRTLRLFQHTNRVFGAELAREHGDLQKVCEAADGGEACDVLAAWDGTSNTDSVGTHIFQEFWKRVPRRRQPVGGAVRPGAPARTRRATSTRATPTSSRRCGTRWRTSGEGHPVRRPWGKLQVAGDEGAPPIPLGGGDAAAGNANVLASRMPATQRGRAVPDQLRLLAHPGGRVPRRRAGSTPRTILTYSQSTDPTSPFSADQTRLFSKEKWVTFAFTPAQIRATGSAARWSAAGSPWPGRLSDRGAAMTLQG